MADLRYQQRLSQINFYFWCSSTPINLTLSSYASTYPWSCSISICQSVTSEPFQSFAYIQRTTALANQS